MNASIAVSELTGGIRNFHVSGKIEASTEPQDMRLQRMLGHLPALLHPNPKSVLIVPLVSDEVGQLHDRLPSYNEQLRDAVARVAPDQADRLSSDNVLQEVGNRLAGFATDVFPKEPPDPHPLYTLPNVIALPHIASYTPATAARMSQAALENLLAGLRGELPEHAVNPEAAGSRKEHWLRADA